jgi:nucleoside-diphosphate-sugar epimerase
MKILVTGNMGYVGSVVTKHLRAQYPDCEIVGIDTGLFAHCLTTDALLPETGIVRQVFRDVRDLGASDVAGFDAVIHLAAISNDPMGDRYAAQTADINHLASMRLAHLARDAGVRNFVFASSCSVYGASGAGARNEHDATNPQTAYARSKIATEQSLAQFERGRMSVTCLRFATACGMSDRLRLDLVLNDFVACALTSGEITVLSDGTPWRPLIAVSDMARAIDWAAHRSPDNGGSFLIANVGSEDWNYQVKDLAQAVAAEIQGITVSINTNAAPDTRSYQVDFSLFRELAPSHQPLATLQSTIRALKQGLEKIGFVDRAFRDGLYIRLKVLSALSASGRISADLRPQF